MTEFKTLSQDLVDEREQRVVKYWQDIDLLKRSVETREGKEDFVFYEGPPTANGKPGICLLYTSPSPRDGLLSRMPSSA